MAFESVRIDVHVWPHLKKYYEQDATFLKRYRDKVYYVGSSERIGIVLLKLLEPQPRKVLPRSGEELLPVITFDLGRHTEMKLRSYLSDENEINFNRTLHKDFKRDAIMHMRVLHCFGVSLEKCLLNFYKMNGLDESDLNPDSLMQEFKRTSIILKTRDQSGTQGVFAKPYPKTA